MDFAKLMSSAISQSKAKPSTSTASSLDTTSSKTKYLKRSELEAQREAAYRAEQAAAEEAAATKAAQKRQREADEADRAVQREQKRRVLAEASRVKREEEARHEEAARRARLGLPPLPDPATDGLATTSPDDAAIEDMDEDALIAALRARSEPARLFGETHAERLRRHHNLATAAAAAATKLSDTIIPTTLKLLPETDMQIPDVVPEAGPARDRLFQQLASYFTLVLTAWRTALAARPAEVAASTAGRQAAAALDESVANLQPLFRHFEAGALPDAEMLVALMAIVRAAQARRYVDANNKYLELSIGNKAWPIGVVSVGIHERASRSRIGEERRGVAHIMGDEVARRWLQAIKRCITFAQTRWPPDDHMQLMG